MDRDVGSTPPLTPADAVPPYSPDSTRKCGLVGVGIVAAAAALGLAALGMGESPPHLLTMARVLLVVVGVITTGAAISMRSDLWWTWGLGAIASVLAVFGLPNSWDSFQLFFTVAAGAAAAGMLLCLISSSWRYVIVSAFLLYHFSGIFCATTAPPVTPWLTEQLFTRVYNPYLQFVYLRNAYHFYSPEPGPASILAFLLKTETGELDSQGNKKYQTRWVVLPKRPDNVRDPLGLGYYRLISLSENVSRGTPGLLIPTEQFEKSGTRMRRNSRLGEIPLHRVEPVDLQYKLPNPEVARYVLPSYARHIIADATPDAQTAKRTTVKVYRLEHRNLPADQMAKLEYSPYHPGTYRPFFLGEFDAYGDLVDPQEVLLYWMIPIDVVEKPATKDSKTYKDYMSAHALGLPIDQVYAADENNGIVFNWSQLR